MRPGALDLHPDGDDHVSRRQLFLPARHLVQEVRDELGRQHVLKLHLKKDVIASVVLTRAANVLKYKIVYFLSGISALRMMPS